MSLIATPPIPYPPPMPIGVAYNAASAGARLNASGNRVAHMFVVPPEMSGLSIQKIGWRTGTVTTSETLRIGVYTTSSGTPTSTAYGSSAYVTRASVATGTYYEETLSSPAACTTGDEIAVVWEPDAFSAMDLYVAVASAALQLSPGMMRFAAAAWSFATATPALYLISSTGVYVPLFGPMAPKTAGSFSMTNATASVEAGNVMTVPFACRVLGIWTAHFCQNSSANFQLVLYNGIGSSVLGSATVTGGTTRWTTVAPSNPQFVYLAAPVTLTAGQQVLVSLKPTSSANVQLNYFDLNAAGEEAAYGSRSGDSFYAKTSGSWTPTTTRLARIGLIVDQLDSGAAGGLLLNPGTNGGFQ